MVSKALDMGVTLFDTADVYGGRGKSEEFLGAALKGRRREAIVATKFRSPDGRRPALDAAARAATSWTPSTTACAASQTDYIDLYQIHGPDAQTPIEETLRALDDVVRSGKVRYIGCSQLHGLAGRRVARGCRVSQNLVPFISAQNQYNLLDRRIERELMPACEKYGLGILPYFPLASGFLTGKYRAGEKPPEGTRLAAWGPRGEQMLSDDELRRAGPAGVVRRAARPHDARAGHRLAGEQQAGLERHRRRHEAGAGRGQRQRRELEADARGDGGGQRAEQARGLDGEGTCAAQITGSERRVALLRNRFRAVADGLRVIAGVREDVELVGADRIDDHLRHR